MSRRGFCGLIYFDGGCLWEVNSGKLKHWERKSCGCEVGFNFCFWLFGWTPALTSSYNVCFSFRTSTSWPNTCNTTSEKSQIHGQTCELEISHVRPNMRLRICASWGHALWPATTLLTLTFARATRRLFCAVCKASRQGRGYSNLSRRAPVCKMWESTKNWILLLTSGHSCTQLLMCIYSALIPGQIIFQSEHCVKILTNSFGQSGGSAWPKISLFLSLPSGKC